jgi:hypothetical protein
MSAGAIQEKSMNEVVHMAPYLALVCGGVLIGNALRLSENRLGEAVTSRRRSALLALLAMSIPSVSHAQVNLQTSVEAGNAIIMYLCGIFAAVGIVTAGVSMMAGRPTIAKWAFAGAMVSGLGFAIVKTMWTNFGLTPADVSTFTP